MRGTSCVETFTSIAALPPEALILLDDAAGLFAGRDWWDVVLAHAMPAGAVASFVGIRSGGKIIALMPMLLAAGRCQGAHLVRGEHLRSRHCFVLARWSVPKTGMSE